MDEAKRIVEAKLAKVEEAIELITFGHLSTDDAEDAASPAAAPPSSAPAASEPPADEQPEPPGVPGIGGPRPSASKRYDRRVADAELAVEERQRER